MPPRDTDGRLLGTSKPLLRDLLPFEDGDTLEGRKDDIESVLAIVAAAGFRFGVVWGRSGSGKTSLLRAGIMPMLRMFDFAPIYVERPADDLLIDMQATVRSWRAVVGADADANAKPIVVVIDQLEEFFLRRSREDHHLLGDLMSVALRSAGRKISFLVGIREDFFGKLHHLDIDGVQDPTRRVSSREVEEFVPDVAENILKASVASNETQFSDELIRLIVHDLTTSEGRVRPVELQIVASILKRRHVKQRSGYDSVGGARDLLKSYIEDEIARCPEPQVAASILRSLCAEGRPVKSPVDIAEDQLASNLERSGLSLGQNRRTLRPTLDRLIEARLIVRTGGKLYNLVHDYLAPLVVLATTGRETDVELANRRVVKYLAEFREDPRARIPRRHIRHIRAKADRVHLQNPTLKKLLLLSAVAAVFPSAMVAAAVIVPVVTAGYLVLFTTEYLSTTSAKFLQGRPAIVVKNGHPWLKPIPGFDEVTVDTGYSMLDLIEDPENLDAIPREALTFAHGSSIGDPNGWSSSLVERLSPEKAARFRRMTGNALATLEVASQGLQKGNIALGQSIGLAAATADQEVVGQLAGLLVDHARWDRSAANAAAQFGAGTALGVLVQEHDKGAFLPTLRDTLDAYTAVVQASPGMPDYRVERFQAAATIAILAAPSLAGDDVVASLLDVATNENESVLTRESVLDLLATIGIAVPERASTIFARLAGGLAARPNTRFEWDSSETNSVRALIKIAQVHPEIVTSQSLVPLTEMIVRDPDYLAAPAYGIIAGQMRSAIVPGVLDTLRSCVSTPSLNPEKANRPLFCGLALLRLDPNSVSEQAIRAQFARALKSERLSIWRSAAHFALTRNPFSEADADQAALFEDVVARECDHDSYEILELPNGYVRLYEVAKANPKLVTPSFVTTLMKVMENCPWASAGGALLQVVAAFVPEDVLSLGERLRDIGVREGVMRDEAASAASNYQVLLSALARAEYVRNKGDNKVSLSAIERQLRIGHDAEQRTYGSYAAYLFWLDQPGERASIEKRLRELVAEPQAELRIAASRALEMIWVGQLTLARDFPFQPGLALARIEMFAKFPEEHVASAARIAMEKWIDFHSEIGKD